MTTKEYLQQYRRLTVRIRQLEEDIRRLEEEIGGTGISNDGMPKGTRISDPTAAYAAQLVELKNRKIRIKAKAWEKRDEIQAVIDAVEDPVCARLLYDRYILCMKWEEAADDLGYDMVYVATKLHRRALSKASEKMTKNDYMSV